VVDDKEAIEHAERDRRNCEEIHRCDSFPMVAQKRKPALGRFGISRRSAHPAGEVRSETSKPSMRSSPWMRGAPQVEFSATILKIKSRTSFDVCLLPTRLLALEISRQYQRKPAR